ncbi:MAG TPA: DNA polymerase I, partial [Dehalococcoidia bacterium]|nr:DNA polymerase I [Dehalococcoidia bacterium]
MSWEICVISMPSLLNRLPQEQGLGPAAGRQLSLLQEEAAPSEATKAAPDGQYTIVDTPEALVRLAARLAEARSLVVDVETTSLQPVEAVLVGIAISPAPKEAYYIPVGHLDGPNLALDLVRQRIGPYLADPQKPKVAHNGNYDLIVLQEHGFEVTPLGSDTILAAFLLGEKAL